MTIDRKRKRSVAKGAPTNGSALGGVDQCDTGEVVTKLRESIQQGAPWFRALLEAVGRWSLAYEEMEGVQYRYLLMGEAFDWLTLAGRLLAETDGLIPVEEHDALLFKGRLPDDLSETEFENLIGPEKYRAHLNFFYGVVVEEALLLAAEESIRKERNSRGLFDGSDLANAAHQRVYGADQDVLLSEFRGEQVYSDNQFMTITDLKEFTYWLFKRRVNSADSARVASDTNKGLTRLFQMRGDAAS